MISGTTYRSVRWKRGHLFDEFVVDFEAGLAPDTWVDRVHFDAAPDRGPTLVYRRTVSNGNSLQLLQGARANDAPEARWVEADAPGSMGPPRLNTFFTDEILQMLYQHREAAWDTAIREGGDWMGWYLLTPVAPMEELLFIVAPPMGQSLYPVVGQVRRMLEELGLAMPRRFVSYQTQMAYPNLGMPIFQVVLHGAKRQEYLRQAGLDALEEPPSRVL